MKRNASRNSRNTSNEHFISPLAHRLEEALSHLQAIPHEAKLLDDYGMPTEELDLLAKLNHNLTVLYYREAKRRGIDLHSTPSRTASDSMGSPNPRTAGKPVTSKKKSTKRP